MRLGQIGSMIFWGLACVLGGAGVAAVAANGFLLAMAVNSPAEAAGIRWPGPHQVQVTRVLDGDTVEVLWITGPCGRGPCAGTISLVRLRGIDTPEVHECRGAARQSCAQCPEELKAGREAKAEAERLLKGSVAVRAREIGPDAYQGRFVARLEFTHGGWTDYSVTMLQAGLAVRYEPEADRSFRKLKPWCSRDQPAGEADGPAPERADHDNAAPATGAAE
ncbi:thermonuclease family protein [Prosthecodimorpha staleyi]|uniref:Thermonuclease family protein n=1 Tax=Prosthecodimorpha staleyi TaxID=2840188 RepID=A0A947DAB0_9HYPH|nr:thermonuclease family protein [Prosthecodimorpha staleyi]MBT9293319.1 thermonuclease family protein [Prosthecodimorpha staleyi]